MYVMTVFTCFIFIGLAASQLAKDQLKKTCAKKKIGKYADALDCSRYYVCFNGYLNAKNCSAGKYFDVEVLKCVESHNATCAYENYDGTEISTANIKPAPAKPKQTSNDDKIEQENVWPEDELEKKCEKQIIGTYPDVEDCSSYYQCFNGRLATKKCPAGNLFDAKVLRCVLSNKATCTNEDSKRKAETVDEKRLEKISPKACTANLYIIRYNFGATYAFGESRYEISNEVFTNAEQSESICGSLCGHLAEVDDHEEETFLRVLMERNNFECLLISGREEDKPGQFVGSRSREALGYIHWATEQPKGFVGDGQCLFYMRNYDGMVKMPCAKTELDCHFVCEI